jgi:hypothetical protein
MSVRRDTSLRRHPERSRFSGGAKSLPRADTRGDLARITSTIKHKLIPESLQ